GRRLRAAPGGPRSSPPPGVALPAPNAPIGGTAKLRQRPVNHPTPPHSRGIRWGFCQRSPLGRPRPTFPLPPAACAQPPLVRLPRKSHGRGHRFEMDSIAETLQAIDEVPLARRSDRAVEIVGSQIPVVDRARQQVIDRDQDPVADSECRALWTAAGFESPVFLFEVAALLLGRATAACTRVVVR